MNSIVTFFSENFWATALSLGTISTMIAGVFNGWLKPNKVWRQVIAWIISIGLTVCFYFLKFVVVADPVWLSLTATGLVVGLVSNGVYDIPTMEKFVENIFHELPVASQQKK